jgi:hypothetical protein
VLVGGGWWCSRPGEGTSEGRGVEEGGWLAAWWCGALALAERQPTADRPAATFARGQGWVVLVGFQLPYRGGVKEGGRLDEEPRSRRQPPGRTEATDEELR